VLEKPDLQDESIIACLRDEYRLPAVQVSFLPLGADMNTAVYRAVARDGSLYFVKLRRGVFEEITVTLPKFLRDQGIEQIIPPLVTHKGQLWAGLGAFKLILYPYIEGRNGYEVDLSDRHWSELGTALRRIHTTTIPPELKRRLQQESYSPQWRETLAKYMLHIGEEIVGDVLAAELVVFLKAKRDEILDLVRRTERLALELQACSPEFVLCHSDIHAGNVMIDTCNTLYIVDWDNPILAPKERDLMYAGGGQFEARRTPQEEEALFYRGYGQAQVDPIALAYYRYERIVQDLVIYCEQLLLTDEGGKDREQSLRYLMSNFLPNGTIEIAYRGDKTWRG
jgi:spectinomycin phosphotransferase